MGKPVDVIDPVGCFAIDNDDKVICGEPVVYAFEMKPKGFPVHVPVILCGAHRLLVEAAMLVDGHEDLEVLQG